MSNKMPLCCVNYVCRWKQYFNARFLDTENLYYYLPILVILLAEALTCIPYCYLDTRLYWKTIDHVAAFLHTVLIIKVHLQKLNVISDV